MMKLFGALVIALALTACGKGADKGGGGDEAAATITSCDKREMKGSKFKTCSEMTGSNWNAKEVKAQCAKYTFIDGLCPSEGVVFSCKNYPGTPSESVTRYYNEAEAAKAACERLKGEAL